MQTVRRIEKSKAVSYDAHRDLKERKENTMKRAIKAFAAAFFAAFMCIFGGINAFAWDADTSHLYICFGEVPEGTAFADILVKEDWKRYKGEEDCIHGFNGNLLGLDGSCELAKYNKDGYSSLLLKHSAVILEEYDLSQESKNRHMVLGLETTDNIFDHYRHIKVAYCDKDGKILGITNEVRVKSVPFGKAAYTIKADGSKLTCDVDTGPPFYLLILIPLGAILLLLIVIICLAIRIIRKKQSANMIKRIQSGETDNERK